MKKYFFVLTTIIILMIFLPYLSCFLSISPSTNNNWKKTAEIMYKEGDHPKNFHVKLDNWIDANIILPAYLISTKNFKNTLLNKSFISVHKTNSLYSAIVKGEEQKKFNYVRYWNGFVPCIRILHNFFDLNGIRIFIQVMLACSIYFIIKFLFKNALYYELFSIFWLLSLSDLFYIIKSVCLPIPFIVGFWGTFLILKKQHYKFTFFMIGFLCWYFDRLTVTLLSVMIPMLICSRILYNLQKKSNKIKIFCNVFIIPPFLGFLGIISSILVRFCLLKILGIPPNMWDAIKFRTSFQSTTDIFTYLDVLSKNWSYFISHKELFIGFILIILFILLLWNIYGILKKKKYIDNCLYFGYLLISISPTFIYYILSNHSYIHARFTYRYFSAIIPALVMVLSSFKKVNKNETNHSNPMLQ